MEIRAATIVFSKRKAKQKRDKEKHLLEKFNRLQEQLRLNFNEATKAEMGRVKNQTCENNCQKNSRRNDSKQSALV